MISNIFIKNVAVIKEIKIDFSDGFNVFTGETGAGKSILIDSISAALGKRVNKNIVRYGEKFAEINVSFINYNEDAKRVLSKYGYNLNETLVLTRIINCDSKSICKINGKVCTVNMLKELGEVLVNVYGQNDNIYFLNEKNHQSFIDDLGNLNDYLKIYKNNFKELVEKKKIIDSIIDEENERLKRIEVLHYIIKEIKEADVKENELLELNEKLKSYKSKDDIVKTLVLFKNIFSQEDNIISKLYTILKRLENINNISEDLNKIHEKTNNVFYSLEDLSFDVDSILPQFETNIDIDYLESRIDLIKSLVNKYDSDLEKFLQNSISELNELNEKQNSIDFLEKEAENLLYKLQNISKDLSVKRENVTNNFLASVKKELEFLDMPNVSLSFINEKTKLKSNGIDNIILQISTNKGQPPYNISKVASGGELSRLMLSIKSIMSTTEQCCTLIFDEIDTGVSGKTSSKIGTKLKQISKNNQVICITHSAQIASYAKTHLKIEKIFDENNTYTIVKNLSFDEKKEELARIMFGEPLTKNALDASCELLKNSL